MGCNMQFLRWLSEQQYLPRRGRLLDIGESCLLAADPADIQFIHDRHGGRLSQAKLTELATTFARRSRLIGDPVIPTLFLSEMLELTDVEYVAFDVVAARKAELFDINIHSLSPARRAWFDLVINFGTTEHLLNQFNAFKVSHEATRPGGYMFHQVPTTGYVKHGYFAYNPLLFRELGEANGYEILALWYWGQDGVGTVAVNPPGLPGAMEPPNVSRNPDGTRDVKIPDSLINVLYRKVHDSPFRVGLEVATSAAALCTSRSYDSPFIERSIPAAPPGHKRALWRRAVRRLIRISGFKRPAA